MIENQNLVSFPAVNLSEIPTFGSYPMCYDSIVARRGVNMPKIGINISERSLEFLDKSTENRSAFIDALIEVQRKKDFHKELAAQYAEQNEDPEFQEEIKVWDCVVGDGIPYVE